jgi:Na+-translocating ferredoxin:NAD+ oxidoreductase RnfE subunit
LLEHVSGLEPGVAMDLAVRVLGAVRELVGDHVAHNAYFIDCPDGAPDTVEFWVSCLRGALVGGGENAAMITEEQLRAVVGEGWLDQLSLPAYGTYQHSYADLVAVHDELLGSVNDRVTMVHLGGLMEQEIQALYLMMAGSPTLFAGRSAGY